MPHFLCRAGLPLLVAGLSAVVGSAAGAVPAPSASRQERWELTNGWIRVQWDAKSETFSATAGKVPFIRTGRLRKPGGAARLTAVESPLGRGQALEVGYPDGSHDRLALFPGVPFLCVQSRLVNRSSRALAYDRISLASISLGLSGAPSALRVLGYDGLTGWDRPRASYTFLAAAEPRTRTGIVAGWLSHDRASGIVRSSVSGGRIRLDAQSDYGNLRLRSGQRTDGEWFAIGHFDDCHSGLERYASTIARYYRIALPPLPSGYCSWYSRPHGGAADQRRVDELARFAHRHLARFGFEVVQVDDGWQVQGRDYTTHHPQGPFPRGMRPTASLVRSLGLRPGLWLIPFGWDAGRPQFRDHQDWFVRRKDGSPYRVKWAGTCLDLTHPDARAFLRDTVTRITRDWGFRYLKLDGLWAGMAAESLYPFPSYREDRLGEATFHDASKTSIEAYRSGLKLIRSAAGPGVYLLGCTVAQNPRTLGASFGRVDGMRIGPDIDANWSQIQESMEAATRLYFFHNRVWHNDPDCLLVRRPLTLDQARSWASWIALSGQSNIVSEWLPGLPEQRLDLIRRSMPNTGHTGRPIDLFERDRPQIWQLTAGHGPSRRDLVGLFNWSDATAARTGVDLRGLRLPDHGTDAYVGFEYWTNRFLRTFRGRLETQIPAGACRVISLRPASSHPQVISTSRHISQGLVDLVAEKWVPNENVLTGESGVVGADPYEIRIATPPGRTWRATAAEVIGTDRNARAIIYLADTGPDVRVRVSSPVNQTVIWRVRFRQESR